MLGTGDADCRILVVTMKSVVVTQRTLQIVRRVLNKMIKLDNSL